MTSPEEGRKVQHPRTPLQPKPPTHPREPQSAQPPPGALVSRTPEPAPGSSMLVGPEAEPSRQAGALPRAEQRAALRGKPSSPPPPPEEGHTVFSPRGQKQRPSFLLRSPRCRLPKVTIYRPLPPRNRLQKAPLPEVGHSENQTVSSTRTDPQNLLPHPRTNQQNPPPKDPPQDLLPQHTQRIAPWEKKQVPTKGRHTEKPEPSSLPKRMHIRDRGG